MSVPYRGGQGSQGTWLQAWSVHTVLLLLTAGTAMVWFAHPALGFAMYFPVAVGTLLLPWGGEDYSTSKGLQLLPYHTLGAALFNSAVAAALTHIGAGTAMIFAMWGGAGLLIALCLTQVRACDTVAVGGWAGRQRLAAAAAATTRAAAAA